MTEPKRAGRPRAQTDAKIRDLATQVALVGHQLERIEAAQHAQERQIAAFLERLDARSKDQDTRRQQALDAAVEDIVATIRTDTKQLVVLFPQLQAQQAAVMKLMRLVYGAPEERTV